MPRAYFFTRRTAIQLNTSEAVIDAVGSGGGLNALIIVEGIDSSWETTLENAWKIESAFFRLHRENPQADELWQDIMIDRRKADLSGWGPSAHIESVFEYPSWKLKDHQAFHLNDFA